MVISTLSNDIISHVRGAFAFDVGMFPLSGPDNMRTPYYGLFRDDTNQIVGEPVTAVYVPHQVDDVLAMVEAASEAFDGVAQVKCYFNRGHHVTIIPSKQQRIDVFGTADNVLPRFRLFAGYDGQAVSGSMGFFRDACLNMSRLRTVAEGVFSIRHCGNFREKMDELIAGFDTLAGSWDEYKSQILLMESKRVRFIDLYHAVYGEIAEDDKSPTARNARERRTMIMQRIHREREATGRPDHASSFLQDWMISGWEGFNGIQGYVQHDAPCRAKGHWDRVLRADKAEAVAKAEAFVLAY